jgi:hypothetical protein
MADKGQRKSSRGSGGRRRVNLLSSLSLSLSHSIYLLTLDSSISLNSSKNKEIQNKEIQGRLSLSQEKQNQPHFIALPSQVSKRQLSCQKKKDKNVSSPWTDDG